jgi:hypothetical protein
MQEKYKGGGKIEVEENEGKGKKEGRKRKMREEGKKLGGGK